MNFKYIITAAFLLILFSCNNDEVFEKEQYKNVFAFICSTDNVNSKMFSLDKDESVGYFSFSMGGTNEIKNDVTINIVEDKALIETYNKSNYDLDVSKYAKALPKANYEITAEKCIIKAGETKGVIPVNIKPGGLSPDTTYFIAVRVDSYDICEINPSKNYLLYRVYIKNKWANGDGSTTYTLRGKRREEGSTTEISMPGTKKVFPISKNKIRTMAGNETYEASIETLNASAIVLDIADDGRVTILPFKDLQVTQINGDKDYPNKFYIENDGYNTYKTFLLYYKYKLGGKTYEMKEELRLQFNEDDEDE